MSNTTTTTSCSQFKFVEPRIKTLLAGWDGDPLSRDEFLRNRKSVLKLLDDEMNSAFQAYKNLLGELLAHDNFREKWTTIMTQQFPRAAAACLAWTAYDTSKKGVEALFGAEHLLCACFFLQHPNTKRVKWPVLPTMVPELSAWNLAPANQRRPQLLELLDYWCPETDANGDSSTIHKDSEEAFLTLFWDQVDLVEQKHSDESLVFWVCGKAVSSQQCRYANVRIYALCLFLGLLVKQSTKEAVCAAASCCQKSSSPSSLKACARCHCVEYCCRDCQLQHFPRHKQECNTILKELYERYSSEAGIDYDVSSLVLTMKTYMFPKLKERTFPKALQAQATAQVERLRKQGGKQQLLENKIFHFDPNQPH